MKIIACKELGFDLSDPDLMPDIVAKIPACHEGHLEIDFSGCIIDYEATSVVVDTAFDRLEQSGVASELILVFNVKFQEHVFLKCFFLGSKRLGLVGRSASNEEIRLVLSRELRRLGMKLCIWIVDPQTATELTRFVYE
jgi:hypothetical protein